MVKKIFYAILVLVFLFVGVGFFLPRSVHVERSISIDRPVSTVFTLVDGFQTFATWSPWAARDPSAIFETSGPASGVGSRMDWSGDPRLAGKGSQEIIESKPYSLVRTRLQFDQQGEAVSYFSLEETDRGTRLTWGFDTDLTEGQNLFGGVVVRYFGLLFDRWIGGDYETGLAGLKALAESVPNVDFSGLDAQILEVEPVDILFIENDGNQDPAVIAHEIMAFITDNELDMSGQPMTITRSGNEDGYGFDVAIPVRMKEGLELNGAVKAGKSPQGRAVRVIHHGPYDQMIPTYEKLTAYMAAHGLREGPVSWEQYISDPGETDSQDLVTHIYYLIEP